MAIFIGVYPSVLPVTREWVHMYFSYWSSHICISCDWFTRGNVCFYIEALRYWYYI